MQRVVFVRDGAGRHIARAGAVTGVALLTAIVALSPAAGVALAVVITAAAAAVGTRHRRIRVGSTDVSAPLAVFAAAAVAVLAPATLLAVTVWPALAVPTAALCVFLMLAWRAPAAAFAVGLVLFGFEGSVKVLLGQAEGGLPAGHRALGAAFVDACLFSAVAVLVLRDRLRAPRALWGAATRAERTLLILLGVWLAASVLQIAQGGDLGRGLSGFRLFQSYTIVALAALVVSRGTDTRRWTPHALLAVGLAVTSYAAFRVVFGPSDAEREFALGIVSTVQYGGVVRATGSFSSAVGLTSFLTPVVVFALVAGYFMPRVRLLAWVVAALGLIGIVGSYGRAPLFGATLGLVFAVALTLAIADVSVRRKLAAVGLVVAVLGATYAGVWFAGKNNDELRQRAEGVVNPLEDESVNLRFENWGETLDEIRRKPLGHGVGTAGSASAPERRAFKTTDNSFLKVLYEQGIPIAVLFFVGILGVVVAAAARLRRLASGPRAVALAALAGFVAFLGVATTGEYVEQPGKVVAWALLGIALGVVSSSGPEGEGSGATGTEPHPGGT